MTLERIVNKSSGFISVADPYWSDTFVQRSFFDAEASKLDTTAFIAQINTVGLLPVLLDAADRHNADRPLHVVDCGVYMGLFSIAAGLVAQERDISVQIDAYEANPYLLAPIRENIAFYGLSVKLHNHGVSGAKGDLRFSIPDGSMVGARLQAKAALGVGGTREVTCSVVPLSDLLALDDACSLVKLDIEGCEVDAFRSIQKSPEQLRNLFIVEYAPWQGNQRMSNDHLYREWLIDNFAIFSLGNWGYKSVIQELTSAEHLTQDVLQDVKQFNVDLLLVPHDLKNMVALLRETLVSTR